MTSSAFGEAESNINNSNREWTRLRKAYGVAGSEWTRITEEFNRGMDQPSLKLSHLGYVQKLINRASHPHALPGLRIAQPKRGLLTDEHSVCSALASDGADLRPSIA
jgi:hypothetical protein